jgi:hypothetical protein
LIPSKAFEAFWRYAPKKATFKGPLGPISPVAPLFPSTSASLMLFGFVPNYNFEMAFSWPFSSLFLAFSWPFSILVLAFFWPFLALNQKPRPSKDCGVFLKLEESIFNSP